jgi:hypothetical protein
MHKASNSLRVLKYRHKATALLPARILSVEAGTLRLNFKINICSFLIFIR